VTLPGTSAQAWVPAAISAVAVVVLIVTMPAEWADREMPIVSRSAALAEGAADASGRTRPFLVHDAGERWLPPLGVYPAALLRTIGLPAKVAVRLPAVAAAATTAVLVYVFALGLFRDVRTAVLAAALLTVSPAWLDFGRTAGGDLLMAALVLAWLIAVQRWRERPRFLVIVAGGIALGLAAWTQPAGVLSVPAYLAIGLVLMAPRADEWRMVAAALGCVAVPFLAYAVWFLSYPDSFLDTFGRWAIHPAHVRSPLDGVRAVTNWDVLARRAGDYWTYLNPTFLFGGSVFGPLMAPLMGVAWWRRQTEEVARGRRGGAAGPILAGLLVAPLVAVLLDLPRDAGLVVTMAPLGAVLAAPALVWLVDRLRHRVRASRPQG
jgi:4-amino-4-deoxy-L-arabinose transferase-like glycosyltransferase